MELRALVELYCEAMRDIPVLVTRAHGAELELESVVGDHVTFGMRIIRAVHAHRGWRWRWRNLRLARQSRIGRHGEKRDVSLDRSEGAPVSKSVVLCIC
jgi:hypothetical protein